MEVPGDPSATDEIGSMASKTAVNGSSAAERPKALKNVRNFRKYESRLNLQDEEAT